MTPTPTIPISTADAQIAAAADWILSVEGNFAVREILRRYRNSLDQTGMTPTTDDLCADALARFVSHVRRNGPIDPFEPERYLSTIVRNLLHDRYRGRRTRMVEYVGLADDVADDATSPDFGPIASGVPREWRTAVESADASWEDRAAALAYLTLLGHPGSVPDFLGVPTPVQGATEEETARWHALWFSGRRRELFPDEQGDPPARRKARSRAGRAVRDLVERAISTVRLSTEESDD